MLYNTFVIVWKSYIRHIQLNLADIVSSHFALKQFDDCIYFQGLVRQQHRGSRDVTLCMWGLWACPNLCDNVQKILLLSIVSILLDTDSWLGDRKGIRPVKNCWFVGGDNSTGALHILYLQLSPPPPSSLASIKSRIETFWYRLTQVHLENGR